MKKFKLHLKIIENNRGNWYLHSTSKYTVKILRLETNNIILQVRCGIKNNFFNSPFPRVNNVQFSFSFVSFIIYIYIRNCVELKF